MTQISDRPSPLVWRVGVALLALLVLILTFHLARGAALARLDDQARAAAAARVQALESVLATQRAVATILSDDGLVQSALSDPALSAQDAVSRKLDRLRDETGSTVIYLLDATGLAVAASNWDEVASFVGEDYSFRDYYTRAMAQGTALQFALGSVSHRPGLYLSHDVQADGSVLGVVVVKKEFGALEALWAESPDATHVTDADGQVVISSDAADRFAPLAAEPGMVSVTLPVPAAPGWALRLATSAAPAWQAGALAAGAMLGLQVLLAGLAMRAATATRYRADLERAVADRTRDLTAEMAERRAAEERLARLQTDLVQANKLATLGQVTAGVAHEVNQPLATIRLLAENGIALMPAAPDETRANLSQIVRMTERIAQITTHLRGFARKATGQTGAVPVAETIEASVLLTASRRRSRGARLVIDPGPPGLQVRAEAVRLEQVLVNLIQNAQDACEASPAPEIRVTAQSVGAQVEITVSDNGPGLTPEVRAQLFTPFATSKPDGLGLGLVIAQDIARDLGGELSADPASPGEGATFRLTLVRA